LYSKFINPKRAGEIILSYILLNIPLIASEMLTSLGYYVSTVSSSEEGIDYLREKVLILSF